MGVTCSAQSPCPHARGARNPQVGKRADRERLEPRGLSGFTQFEPSLDPHNHRSNHCGGSVSTFVTSHKRRETLPAFPAVSLCRNLPAPERDLIETAAPAAADPP
eukprot:355149-Chlamydomonas_euryale.AAC.5